MEAVGRLEDDVRFRSNDGRCELVGIYPGDASELVARPRVKGRK